MRAASPVQITVGAGAWIRRVGDSLCLLAACSLWLALEAHGVPVLLASMVTALAVLVWRRFHARWWGTMQGLSLQWDGTVWRLRDEGRAVETGALRVAWDAQTLMLLQWQADPPNAARRWLVLSQQRHPEVWPSLRLAVWASDPP